MNTELFEQVEALQSGTDFYTLAKSIHQGESADPRVIVDACNGANKTANDFRNLVSTLDRRNAEREDHARLEGIREQEKELRAKVDAANVELEAATERHQKICLPLQYEMRELSTEAARLARIPSELSNSCPNENLHNRQAQLRAQQRLLTNATVAAERKLQHC